MREARPRFPHSWRISKAKSRVFASHRNRRRRCCGGVFDSLLFLTLRRHLLHSLDFSLFFVFTCESHSVAGFDCCSSSVVLLLLSIGAFYFERSVPIWTLVVVQGCAVAHCLDGGQRIRRYSQVRSLMNSSRLICISFRILHVSFFSLSKVHQATRTQRATRSYTDR